MEAYDHVLLLRLYYLYEIREEQVYIILYTSPSLLLLSSKRNQNNAMESCLPYSAMALLELNNSIFPSLQRVTSVASKIFLYWL